MNFIANTYNQYSREELLVLCESISVEILTKLHDGNL